MLLSVVHHRLAMVVSTDSAGVAGKIKLRKIIFSFGQTTQSTCNEILGDVMICCLLVLFAYMSVSVVRFEMHLCR